MQKSGEKFLVCQDNSHTVTSTGACSSTHNHGEATWSLQRQAVTARACPIR